MQTKESISQGSDQHEEKVKVGVGACLMVILLILEKHISEKRFHFIILVLLVSFNADKGVHFPKLKPT